MLLKKLLLSVTSTIYAREHFFTAEIVHKLTIVISYLKFFLAHVCQTGREVLLSTKITESYNRISVSSTGGWFTSYYVLYKALF